MQKPNLKSRKTPRRESKFSDRHNSAIAVCTLSHSFVVRDVTLTDARRRFLEFCWNEWHIPIKSSISLVTDLAVRYSTNTRRFGRTVFSTRVCFVGAWTDDSQSNMENRPAPLRSRRVCRFCLTETEPLSFIYERDHSKPFQVPLTLQIMSCVAIEVIFL